MISSQIFGKTKQCWFHSGGFECSLLFLGTNYKNLQISHISRYYRNPDIHLWYDRMPQRSYPELSGRIRSVQNSSFFFFPAAVAYGNSSQGLEPSLHSDPSCFRDNARSLTHCTTAETPRAAFLFINCFF